MASPPAQGLTAYHDISLDKCYVIELNTTIVLPPRNFWELLMNVKVSQDSAAPLLSLVSSPREARLGAREMVMRVDGPRDISPAPQVSHGSSIPCVHVPRVTSHLLPLPTLGGP
jgi:hypothetical protein